MPAFFDYTLTAPANGNIHPSRAVMGDTTKKFNIIEGTVGAIAEGALCLGISMKCERRDPSNSDGFAAVAGEGCMYYGNGAKDIPAQLGGTVTAFAELKCGASGKLVLATTAGDRIVAVAKQDGILDDVIDVDVVIRFKM
jgi:hypothetical protein